jgi:hypothetical protein
MRQTTHPLHLLVGKLSPLWRDATGEISGSRTPASGPRCPCMHGKGFADTFMLRVLRKTKRDPLVPFLAPRKQ